MCVAPALLPDSGSQNALASDKEFTLLCKSWFFAIIWFTVVGFLRCCKDNSSLLACLVCSFSSHHILLNSSISLSLWAWSAHWLAWFNRNRWYSNYWLNGPDFAFHNSSPQSPPQPDTQFAEPLSLLEWPSQLFHSKIFLEIISISQRMHKIQLSISFPSRLWTRERCCNRFSVQLYLNFLMARTTWHMTYSGFPWANMTEQWRNSACCGFLAAA